MKRIILVSIVAIFATTQQAGVYLISNNGEDVGDDYTQISNNLIVNDQNAYCAGSTCNNASGTLVLGGYKQGHDDTPGTSSVDNGHCIMGTTDNNFITLLIPEDIALFDTSYQGRGVGYVSQGASFPLTATATPQVSQLCYDMASYLMENFSRYDACLINYLRSKNTNDCTSPCSLNEGVCGIPTGSSYPPPPVIGEYVNPTGTSYCTVGFPTKSADFKLRIRTNFLTNTTHDITINTNYMPTDGQSVSAALQAPPISFFDTKLSQKVSCTLIPDTSAGYDSSLTASDLVTAYTWLFSYVNWINTVFLPGFQNTTGYPGQCPFASDAPSSTAACTNNAPQSVQNAFPAFYNAYATFITQLSDYITNAVSSPLAPVPTVAGTATAPVSLMSTAAALTMPAPPALMLVCSPVPDQVASEEAAAQTEITEMEQFFNQFAGQLTPPLPALFGDQTSLDTYFSQQMANAVAKQCPNISQGLQTVFNNCATTAGTDFISCVQAAIVASLLPNQCSDGSDPTAANLCGNTLDVVYNGECLHNLDNVLSSILSNYAQVLQNQTFVADANQAMQTFTQTVASNMQYSSCAGVFGTDANGFPVIGYKCPIDSTDSYVPAYSFRFFFECPSCSQGQQCSCQNSDGTYNTPLYSIQTSVPMNTIFQSPQLPATDPSKMTNNTEDFSCGFCNAHETTSLFESVNPFNGITNSGALEGIVYNKAQTAPVCCNGFIAQFASTPPASCVMGQPGYPNVLYVSNLINNPISVGLSGSSQWLGSDDPPYAFTIGLYSVNTLISQKLDNLLVPQQVGFSTNNWGLPASEQGAYYGAGGVWVGYSNWTNTCGWQIQSCSPPWSCSQASSSIPNTCGWTTGFYPQSSLGGMFAAPSAISLGTSLSLTGNIPLTYIAFNGGAFDPSSGNSLWSYSGFYHTPSNCRIASINQLNCVGQMCTAYDSNYNEQITGGCYDPNIS